MSTKQIKDPKISDLTVSQFQRLIRKTVQQAVAEVIMEMSMVSQMDDNDQIEYEAELTDYIRNSLNTNTPITTLHAPKRDD
jgi:transglutaminase/protease-like cytokinesis protein 3